MRIFHLDIATSRRPIPHQLVGVSIAISGIWHVSPHDGVTMQVQLR